MRDGVCIVGSYGNQGVGNLGDEAILDVLYSYIRSAYPAAPLFIFSESPQYTAARLPEATVVPIGPSRFWQHAGIFRRSKVLIMGGGGLLQDIYPHHIGRMLVPLYYLSPAILARLLGCRVLFFAQGVGPLRTWLGHRAAALGLRAASAITVRDAASAETLQRLGLSPHRFRVAADPAVLLEPPPAAETEAVLRQELGEGDDQGLLLGVGLRPWLDNGHYPVLAAALAAVAAALDARVLFVPFHPATDIDAAEQVQAGLPVAVRSRSHILRTPLTPAAALGVCGRLHLALGMRLHFTIMCCMAQVPVVSLAYDQKVTHLLTAVGLPEAALPLGCSDAQIAAALLQLHNRRTTVQEILRTGVAGLQAANRANLGALDALMV